MDEIPEITNSKKKIILDKLLKNLDHPNKIDVSDDVYNDTLIDNFVSKLPILEGGKILIDKIIHNPINDINKLIERQNAYIDEDIDFNFLKEYENDVLWTFVLNKEIRDDLSIKLIYPSSYIISYINYFGPILDFYHIYKIFIIPFLSILYPLTLIYGPYYYVKKYFNMSFKDYMKILISCFKSLLKPSGNLKTDLIKFITVAFYIGIYIFNMYQTFDMAYLVYKTKEKLHKKMDGLIYFIKESTRIINEVPEQLWKPYYIFEKDIEYNNLNKLKLENTMTDLYKIWKDDDIKDQISKLLKIIYTIDVVKSISKLIYENKWSLVKFVDTETKIWDMKNPILDNNQISNPINLSKNIIVTGPNAAGKTTYIKSITANIILAQTFGITYSSKSEIVINDTIKTFMRIVDILGNRSYFEAEAEYCSNMINNAKELVKNNKRGFFILDEPMHSTPPIEGMSTAFAVLEYLGNLPGINIIVTTHYHKLIDLEKLYPNNFINLSVDAFKNKDNITFTFPYKIKRGFSKQCIAIELLEKQKFPESIIKSAIEIKNKICEEIYSSNNQ